MMGTKNTLVVMWWEVADVVHVGRMLCTCESLREQLMKINC